ncbi:unnamed protein product [Ambrosiozyma monospora]|uniref:Unnamed protein product n=1 Tax=Ambrosiozyma monospora TaxID=43982 RepID=A0ACB5U906_AMBMO|nr:unnamed protein product [Ambrosiozyma monospora]
MHSNGWRINMFGDDTWLKLFPDYFSKTDGTASFYVSDFTIVDKNVTRHLDYELSDEGKSQWDCLILHYLGLDHIGHKGGPGSSNMPVKQFEMDSIVKKIFHDVLEKNENTLLVVMGDHGMNEKVMIGIMELKHQWNKTQILTIFQKLIKLIWCPR